MYTQIYVYIQTWSLILNVIFHNIVGGILLLLIWIYHYLVLSLIFQFPVYLEPSSWLPIHQVAIDPWFQEYRELEDKGIFVYSS